MMTRREFLMRTTAGVLAAESFQIIHASRANANAGEPGIASASVVQTVLGPIDASKLGFTLRNL